MLYINEMQEMVACKQYQEIEKRLVTISKTETNSFLIFQLWIQYGVMVLRKGEYKRAIQSFHNCLSFGIMKDEVLCLLGQSYAMYGMEEESELCYYRTYYAWREFFKTENEVRRHIEKHNEQDVSKRMHTVFYNPYSMEQLSHFITQNRKQLLYGTFANVYCIPQQNCGYQIVNGSERKLDCLTIVSYPLKDKIITAYPSQPIPYQVQLTEDVKGVIKEKRLYKIQLSKFD